MNTNYTLCSLLGCLLLLQSCKKDSKTDPDRGPAPTVVSCDLNTATFAVDLNTSDSFFDVYEDLQRNTILLGKNSVLKYDLKGDQVWSKNILNTGTPQNIIQADGDNYFTTNSTLDINSYEVNEYYDQEIPGKVVTVKKYWNENSTINENCKQNYFLVEKGVNEPPITLVGVSALPVNRSKCFLNKIDKDGNLLWTKTFDGNYFHGRSICKMDDGSFALLTYKASGFYQTLYMDTLHQPIDQNSVTIYKLDRHGNIQWSKTISGIISEFQNQKYSKVYRGARIVSVQNNLFIQTSRQLFVLDGNGNMLKNMKPYGNDCNASAFGMATYNDRVYTAGKLTKGPGSYFTNSLDANGNQVLAMYPDQNHFNEPYNIFAMSDGILAADYYGLEKIDMYREKVLYINSKGVMCANQTCREGIVYVIRRNGTIQLIKTNRYGEY